MNRLNKVAVPLTQMLKTTGSSEVLAPIAIGADDDKVVAGGGRKIDVLGPIIKLSKSSWHSIQGSSMIIALPTLML